MKEINDGELVKLAMKQPEKGFRMLMDKYREAIYWHIRRLVVDYDDAQDATQETFIRVFRFLHQFKGDCSFRSWVYRIGTNEALRIIEQRRCDQLSLDEASEAANGVMADEYVDYTDLEAVRLQQAIQALPTRQQLAFNLRYYDELGYDEIARIMESSTDAAKSNYHLAKEKIIKFMKANN